MSSNALGTKDFNAINGAAPPPVRKATLQKDDKPQLTNNPADKFDRISQAPQSQPKPTEKPNSLDPWMIAGASLLVSLGTVAVVASQVFKRPSEASKTLTEASLKPIVDRLTALEQSVLAGNTPDLKAVETLLQSLKKEIVDAHGAKLDDFQSKLLARITQLETKFQSDTEIPILEIQRDIAEIKATLKNPFFESKESELSVGDDLLVDLCAENPPAIVTTSLEQSTPIAPRIETPSKFPNAEGNLTFDFPETVNSQLDAVLRMGGGSLRSHLLNNYKERDDINNPQGTITWCLDHLSSGKLTGEKLLGMRRDAFGLVGNWGEDYPKLLNRFGATLEFSLALLCKINDKTQLEEAMLETYARRNTSAGNKAIFDGETCLVDFLQKNHPDFFDSLQTAITAKSESVEAFESAVTALAEKLKTMFTAD